MPSEGCWIYTWDAENRLMAMEAMVTVPTAARQKIEFAYDFRGRRVQKLVYNWNAGSDAYQLHSTTKFVYDGWNPVAELDASDNLIRSYLWGQDLSGTLQGAGGIGGLLLISDAGSSYLPRPDGKGNVTALLNTASGAVDALYEYGPSGETVESMGPAQVSHMRFSSKYDDTETGLLYYGLRYFVASTGRWLGRDPSDDLGDLHPYSYVNNDAAGSIDPLGLKRVTIWAAAFIEPSLVVFPYATGIPPVVDPFAIWNGNGRSFGVVGGSSKVWHKVTIETGSDSEPEVSNERGAGKTVVLYRTNPASIIFRVKKGQAGPPEKAKIERDKRTPCITRVTIVGSVSNPLMATAPTIDYSYALAFDETTSKLTFSGSHDHFPWHELYLDTNRKLVADPPSGPTRTPADLVLSSPVPPKEIDY
ncbi:MAG: RHS repeat-associated core domain-containing protein [Acidobacteriota bacterium]